MTVEPLGERVDQGKAFVEALMVGRAEIRQRLPDDAAQAACLQYLADPVLEIVHVGDRGDPAHDHLERREPAAGDHHLCRDELALDRQDVAEQPVVDVFAEAAEQRHRHMAVRIDHPRHDEVAAAIHDLLARHGRRRIARVEAGDRAALDAQPATLEQPHLRVGGEYPGIVKEGRHGGNVRVRADGVNRLPGR